MPFRRPDYPALTVSSLAASLSLLTLPILAQPIAPDTHPLQAVADDPRAWYLAVKALDPPALQNLWAQPWLGPDAGQHRRRWQIIRWLARADPVAAQKLVLATHPPDKALWDALAWGWAEKDLGQALRFALNWEESTCPGLTQAPLLSTIFNVSIKTRQVGWLKENAGRVPPDLQYNALASWTWEWAMQDPEAACRWIMPFRGQPRWTSYLGSGFAQWGRQDPEQAWTALQELHDEGYEAALAGFSRGLMMRDVAEGIRFLHDLAEAQRGFGFLETVGLECGENHPEKGITVWEALADNAQADLFAVAYLQRLTQRKPSEAASLLPNVTDSEKRQYLAREIAEAWHTHDPTAARAWADSLQNSEERAAAQQALVAR